MTDDIRPKMSSATVRRVVGLLGRGLTYGEVADILYLTRSAVQAAEKRAQRTRRAATGSRDRLFAELGERDPGAAWATACLLEAWARGHFYGPRDVPWSALFCLHEKRAAGVMTSLDRLPLWAMIEAALDTYGRD